MMSPTDTIFALGTGAGRAAIAVIRLSGPDVRAALIALTGRLPAAREVSLATLRDPATQEPLDRGIAFFFDAPASPTGEDYAELQINGGRAVIDGTLEALSKLDGLRSAEPGEFARRAFDKGKLDLSQVEALADLIDSQTEFQRRQAIRVAGGALRKQIEEWRLDLIDLMAGIESELDFSDEADVSALSEEKLSAALDRLTSDMRATLAASPASERLRTGYTVLLIGRPNVGKSTLFNRLAGRDAAIVSAIPGTTRDLIEAHLNIGGMPVTLVDTAGLRDAEDEIERIGVERVAARITEADLLLWLSDCGSTDDEPKDADLIRIWTKVDLSPAPTGWLGVSAVEGTGVAALIEEIRKRAAARMGDGGSAIIIRQRHREAIEQAVQHLGDARRNLAREIVAEELRQAARALGRITGAVDVEQVLDAVFSRFCIGK